MRIKLAILEDDRSYLDRIAAVFNSRYADKIETYSFTDPSVALATLETARIDVFLAGENQEINVSEIPKRCGFAYLVNSSGVETVKNQIAVSKYQKADLIYKQVLGIYSETAGSLAGIKIGDESCDCIIFTSPAGGVGTSSVAAACAISLTAKGKKALYLNLEKFGSSDVFFSAEGSFDMSDVIFALKNKKSNFLLKLESCVRRDSRGVFFYSQPQNALDMLELNMDEIIHLITEIKLSGLFDYIIADFDFSLSKAWFAILRQARNIVWVSDGEEISNVKVGRANRAFEILDLSEEYPLMSRLRIIYNKFSNKTGKKVDELEGKCFGGAPRYDRATTAQVLDQLSGLQLFDEFS
jgi:septum formation inhibitor-activating ATPase MinD